MKSAILYIRVSTDEQADRGYSQRNQDEVLKKYCLQHRINILDIIFEDYSAKTFNRPKWTQMLQNLRKQKRYRSKLLLFTKWDRFSRNTSEAYQMISYLRNLGVEPQAIEQPLDLSVPENKMMLAFYLAVPEVENERRGLNVFYGLRRARKEGRWTSIAPIGYLNKSTENGTKYIAPDPTQGKLMKEAFEDLAKGKFAIDQVWRMAKLKGLKCGKSNFAQVLRNPIYCGLITVPAHKDEMLQFVIGQHQALITRETFEKVQHYLNKGRQVKGGKLTCRPELFLRGHLCCPKCTRMLTGSTSTGRNGKYHYYHCSSSCGTRFPAEKVNSQFLEFLKNYNIDTAFNKLFIAIFEELSQSGGEAVSKQIGELNNQLQLISLRMEKNRELLLDNIIDGTDFQEIKLRQTEQSEDIRKRLKELEAAQVRAEAILPKAKSFSLNIYELFSMTSMEQQRRMLHLLFPDFLTYDNNAFLGISMPDNLSILWEKLKI